MMIVYGIPNCDTVKKTLRQLEKQSIQYRLHDFRKNGIHREKIANWCKILGWEKILNKRSTTYRNLTESQKNGMDEQRAIKLMLEHPTLIKRPIIEDQNGARIGL